MTSPDVSRTERMRDDGPDALPALAAFPFPTALVVTGTPATGDGVLHESGDIDEVFPFASVTKPIVAWSALVAVDRGLLDLEAPAGAPAPDGATIGNLLSHSSGIAADSGEGSARDLSLFARELAAPRLVSSALAERACTPVLPGLDGVLPGYGRQAPNPFGLGVEVRGAKSPHWTGTGNSPQTFGHFGQSGSFIWVDPVAGRQAVFLGAEPFGAVHRKTWPALGDQILAL